jgi:hypothetical protein
MTYLKNPALHLTKSNVKNGGSVKKEQFIGVIVLDYRSQFIRLHGL